MPQTECNEAVAGIGNERHPGVADQGDFRALLEGDNQFRRACDLIVFVVADEWLVNVVVSQKFLRMARVFAGNLIDFFEDAQGSQSDVFEIADGRANKIEAAAGCRGTCDVCGLSGRSLRFHADESSMR